MRQYLTRETVARDPNAIWNSSISILAQSSFHKLSEEQRAAHLVFWYESEVQNGGHLQFFENRPEDKHGPTLAALETLGCEGFRPILFEAIGRWRSCIRVSDKSAEGFAAGGLVGEFEDLDSAFYQMQPTVIEMLGRYLADHRDLFVVIDGDI